MLPAAQPPACHDGSLAICLGMATLRAELEPACSLLQYPSPGTTKRATRASQIASTFKRAATPAPSGRTTQRSHEVASHSMLKAVCMAGRPMALTVHLVAQGCLMVKMGINLKAAPMSCLPTHVRCASVRPEHAATAHGARTLQS